MVDFERTKSYVKKFKDSHKGLENTDFLVFPTQKEAFPKAPEEWHEDNIVPGAYYPASNLVVIVSEHNTTIKDLNKTLRHEVFGHLAINRLDEADKYDLLETIVEASSDSWVGKYRDYLSMTTYQNLKDKPFMLAEEVFASTAELSFSEIEPYKSIPNPNLIQSKEDLLDLIDSLKNGIHYGVLEQKIFPETNDAQFKALRFQPKTTKAIEKDDVDYVEINLAKSININMERTQSLSSNTKERILAYGSLMEDEALIDAVGSTDKEVLVSLGEYFQELSQSDYVDYEAFNNSQTQEMRR